jgi:hypothetical protein
VVQELVTRLDQLDSALHRCLLAGVLSARLAILDAETARGLLRKARESVEGATAELARIRHFEVLGLFAGQWWQVDRAIADAMWNDALLLATTGENLDRERRSFQIAIAIRALMYGAPDATLAPLLCHQKPALSPSRPQIVMWGPGTPPLVAAGLAQTDYMLGKALAAAMVRVGSPARGRFEEVEEPTVASMAAALAALNGNDVSLDQRAEWCVKAVKQAERIEKHYLRCLLRANAAEAYLAVGMRKCAFEVAEETAQDVLDNGVAFGAIFREPAYADALGKCVSILSEDRDCVALAKWSGERAF